MDWNGTKCYECNFCSLKERNEVQQCVALLRSWARWRAAIELKDDCGGARIYVQAGPHIYLHRSSAVKAWIEVSSVRPRGGVISHPICVVPRSCPSGNRSYIHNISFFHDFETYFYILAIFLIFQIWLSGQWHLFVWCDKLITQIYCCFTRT